MSTTSDSIAIAELNTVEEVAILFRTNVRQIMNMCRDGKIIAYKIGRNWLVPKSAIVEYLERQRNDVLKETPKDSVDRLVDDLAAIRASGPTPAGAPERDAFDRPIRRKASGR